MTYPPDARDDGPQDDGARRGDSLPFVDPSARSTIANLYEAGRVGQARREKRKYELMILGGRLLVLVPVCLAVFLWAIDAPVEPKSTGLLLSALFVVGIIQIYRGHRRKRGARHR